MTLVTNEEKPVKASVIVFDVPFMINLPDGKYRLNMDNVHASVKLERRNSPSTMAGLPSGVQFQPNSFIIGDRWGKFKYTRVQIVFHHQIFIKPSVLFPDFLLSQSVNVINRILSVCRGVKEDHYIRINGTDIFSYNIFYFDSEDKQKNQSVSVPLSNNMVSMGNAAEPKAEELNKIKEVLWNNAQLPLFQELLFDAWDYNFYGNYRAAVIEAGTAFEVFIQNFIWNKYLQSGKNEKDIEKILEAGLMNLLRDHIKKITGHDFTSTQEFSTWEMDAYKIRNETVHKGRKISDSDAAKALTTVADTINFILSLV